MCNDMKLSITNIQRFSIHDGTGIRTTVFTKGCPLDCKWCHNPETKSPNPHIFYTDLRCIECGACVKICPNKAHTFKNDRHVFDQSACNGCCKCVDVCFTKAIEAAQQTMTLNEIMDIVMRDKVFYDMSSGGITLSGGEPMFHPNECLQLLKKAKESGISTAIETCGFFDKKFLEPLSKVTDIFLWDLKDMNFQRHLHNTGVTNERIIENLMELDKMNVKIILKCIMVKTQNMYEDHYRGIANIFHKLKNCIGVEIMAYHPMGGSKNERLGLGDNGIKTWIPSIEDMDAVKDILKSLNVAIL